ncbi:MAG TPA: winged helix-turn-helix domain-containing protein [Patescibacteria group bacterium]|nr:winged helix-turn-helix domain-containing protein [Patescibacteria group bacterium]
MTKIKPSKNLDLIFVALANQHRREIIYALSLQPHSITQLALQQNLSLPAIHKHIKILEDADMILRKKTKQTNYLALNKDSLKSLQDWVMQYHTYWGSKEQTLENYIDYLNKIEEGGEK